MVKTSFFKALLSISFIGLLFVSHAQENTSGIFNNGYFRLIPGSENSKFNRVELYSDIDTTWQKWGLRGYNFGLIPNIRRCTPR